MNTGIPLYEGDGYLHRRTPSLLQDGAMARIVPRTTVSPDEIRAIELDARRLRAVTVSALLHRFIDWLARSSRHALRGRAEGYLSRSTDTADLERRMRNIERPDRIRIYG